MTYSSSLAPLLAIYIEDRKYERTGGGGVGGPLGIFLCLNLGGSMGSEDISIGAQCVKTGDR
jgi:hypothetical protein